MPPRGLNLRTYEKVVQLCSQVSNCSIASTNALQRTCTQLNASNAPFDECKSKELLVGVCLVQPASTCWYVVSREGSMDFVEVQRIPRWRRWW